MLYHVWFATKNRNWLLVEDIEQAIKEHLWQIAQEKHIGLLECETMVDHVHLLLTTTSDALSNEMRLLKGGSAYRIFKQFPDLKFDAHTNNFWQVSFGSRAVSEDERATVIRYIRTQKERPEKFVR